MSSLLLRVAVMVVVVTALILVPDGSTSAGESATVSAEYTEYVNRDGVLNIGPYVDLRGLFHPANLGPEGVACTAERADVVRNEVEFTFDPAGGSVSGTGLIELSCEYHIGCGAVTRVVEAAYRGVYDPSTESMSGTVDITVPEGETTAWAAEPGESGFCTDRWTRPVEHFSLKWVLNLAQAPATGYHAGVIEGGDPRLRIGFFAVSVVAQPAGDDAGASDGNPTGAADEPVDESAVESVDVAALSEGELDADDRFPIGVFVLALALLLGVGAAILFVRLLLGHGRVPLRRAALDRADRASQQASQVKATKESAWFNEQATHVIEPGQFVWVHNPRIIEQAKAEGKEIPPGMDAPLPLSLEPEPVNPDHPKEPARMVQAEVRDGVTVIYDPAYPDVAVLRTGAQVWIQPEQLTPLPTGVFTPTHELTGTGYIEGRADGQVNAYQPGTPVQVLTTTGDQTLVRVDTNEEVWVPRSSIGSTTAQIDEPT